MSQKSSREPRTEITDQQVADAELLIQGYWPEAKGLGLKFRSVLKDALASARDCYELALKDSPESKPAGRRELETLRHAIEVVRISFGKDEVKHKISDFAFYPSAPTGNRETAFEAWSEWQLKRTIIGKKIDQLKMDLQEIKATIDQGLAKKNSKSIEAIPRHKTNAIAMAAGAFLSQVEELGIPRELWHHGTTPSPAAAIVVGVLDILGVKSSERAIAALKFQIDPNFDLPVPAIRTRARGKRR